MKFIDQSKLQELEIETSGTGFTVWITETDKGGNKSRYWLIDASVLKDSGYIRFNKNRHKRHKYCTVFNRKKYIVELKQLK